MQAPRTEMHHQKSSVDYVGTALGVLLSPLLALGACIVIPLIFVFRWTLQYREHRFRMLMKSRGRFITWQELLRLMRDSGGTCIEERFAPRGPVRFWWTQEDVVRESPHEIIDWFTMRKGGRGEPFVRWCRDRYTDPDRAGAVLVDTGLVPKKEIYALWAQCKSDSNDVARWVEVAPPEILPRRPGQ